jgi:hypothetical protein
VSSVAEIDPRQPNAAFDAYFCPDCEFGLVGVENDPELLYCQRCDKHFAVPAEDRAKKHESRDATDRQDELDGLRIRQLASARRAAYRSRSYCVIAAMVCVVAVVQLAWNGIALLRAAGWGMRPVSYFLFAILAGWGAAFFTRKAMELNREAKKSTLPDPTTSPDFSNLSDGSERWKNLEDVR